MAENGIASAFTARITGVVEAAFSSIAADRSWTLRRDCQRRRGRLRAGSVHSIGHTGAAPQRFGGMAVHSGSQRGNRCGAFATSPQSARTGRGCRTQSMAGTDRRHRHRSSISRRAAAGSSSAGRYHARHRSRPFMERHDVPPDRHCLRNGNRDGSSKIRSGYCATTTLDAAIGFHRAWSYAVVEIAQSFLAWLEPSEVSTTSAMRNRTTKSGN